MKKKNYNEMSTEDLQKGLKTTKFITGLLAGVLIAFLGLNIYLYFQESDSSINWITPIALSPIVFINWNTINQIKNELKSRGNL
jgi:hypothetical protein